MQDERAWDGLDEATLEAARAHREFDDEPADDGLEAARPAVPPSFTPISERAIGLIVFFEVTSPEVYARKYERPVWPGGASGLTIGVGYDVGHTSAAELRAEWAGVLPDAMLGKLAEAAGVQGDAAKALTARLKPEVSVPWPAADRVFRQASLPRFVGLTERGLPNTGRLSGDGLGALVSLVYNRGAPFQRSEPRFAEMRAIRQHMQDGAFNRIPDEIRAMKRLWPTVPGLQARRDREAELFERSLVA